MDAKIFILLVFAVLATVAASHYYRRDKYCSLYNRYYSRRQYSYCSNGCCKYKCCGDDNDIDFSLGAGVIFGIVIGSLIAIVILVSFIVCCVVAICRKSRGHRGMVVHPNPMIVMNTYPNVQYLRTNYPLPPYGNYQITSTTSTTNTQPSAPFPEEFSYPERTVPFHDPPPSYSQSQRMKY